MRPGIKPRRPIPNSKRLAATKLPLKHLKSESNAAARMTLDNPSRTDGVLKRHCSHELLARQILPGRDVGHGGDDDGIKENAHDDRQPDRGEKTLVAEFRTGFLRRLADRFISGHEIKHDLQHQQHRDKPAVREQGREVVGRTPADTHADEHNEERQRSEGCPVLERGH